MTSTIVGIVATEHGYYAHRARNGDIVESGTESSSAFAREQPLLRLRLDHDPRLDRGEVVYLERSGGPLWAVAVTELEELPSQQTFSAGGEMTMRRLRSAGELGKETTNVLMAEISLVGTAAHVYNRPVTLIPGDIRSGDWAPTSGLSSIEHAILRNAHQAVREQRHRARTGLTIVDHAQDRQRAAEERSSGTGMSTIVDIPGPTSPVFVRQVAYDRNGNRIYRSAPMGRVTGIIR